MKYRYSIYTARVVVNYQIYLYNAATDCLIGLSEEIDQLLQKYTENLGDIKSLHNELFLTLTEGKFIVDDESNECDSVITSWKQEDESPLKYTMIINPTLNCNMRCWYCYEKHNKTAYIKEETIRAIQVLIQKKVSGTELRGLNIDFFGGEPLLNFKNGVKPILDYAYDCCSLNKKQLYVSFTTNGFLLSEKVRSDLHKYAQWGKIRLQITLDGNRTVHNQIRALGGTMPTYDTIVANICNSVKEGMLVLVRLNYTNKNINSFYDIIDDFKGLDHEAKKNFSISLQKVWQENNSKQLQEDVHSLVQALKDEGYHVEDGCALSPHRCYGDKENTCVINYNGDVFKCTARDFDTTKRDGTLLPDGTIRWNQRHSRRKTINYGSEFCHHCIIFPLCHAGCSQNKMESSNKGCLKGYSEKMKQKLIEERVTFLINQAQTYHE